MHAQKYMRYDAHKINGLPSAVHGRKVNRFVRRKLKQLPVCAESFGRQDYIDYLWFRRKYADWRTAFETAAQNGAVEFR